MGRERHTGGRKRSPLLFGITFRAILIVAAAAMFLSYISVYVNPSKFSLPLFFGLYFIPILAINLLLLLLALLRRSASAWITVVALLPAMLYSELFFKLGHKEDIGAEGTRLQIESWNVGMFSSSEKTLSREECRKEIAGHLAITNPDIICLQEFFAEDMRQADTIFSNWPHRHYHLFKVRNGKLFGNIILSKFPISERGRISFPNSTNLSIYADIEHSGKKLRIYNNHLESYNVSFTTLIHKFAERLKGQADAGYTIVRETAETPADRETTDAAAAQDAARATDERETTDATAAREASRATDERETTNAAAAQDAARATDERETTDATAAREASRATDERETTDAAAAREASGKRRHMTLREEITNDIVETHGKMKHTFIKRSQQVDRILEDINRSSTPAIICGDFNDTPMSYTYYTLAKNRKDTFKEAGRGFGATFAPIWPLLRIDYILVPSDSECAEHTLHKTSLSDHYPVTATVVL